MPPKNIKLKLNPNVHDEDVTLNASSIINEIQSEDKDVNTYKDTLISEEHQTEVETTEHDDSALSTPLENEENDFVPSPIDYMVRQQQLATFQMLSEFLILRDSEGNPKNVTEVVNEVRISIDVLAKAVLQLNKTMEKCLIETQRKKI